MSLALVLLAASVASSQPQLAGMRRLGDKNAPAAAELAALAAREGLGPDGSVAMLPAH